MNKKIVSLALSGALTLSLLAACGSPDTEGSTPPVSTPPATESLAPTETPAVTPSQTPEPTESVEPTETPAPSESQKPSESPEPSESQQQPSESPKPSESQQQPSETPAPSESQQPTESPSASVVQSIWNEVSGLERPSLLDVDAALLSDLYGIESSDLVEFVAKMPLMSAHVTEFLIAQCAPGRVDAVKAACEARLETLKGGNQYPETLTLLENYKLVTSGDYLLFCIDEYADEMVEAFNTYAK